jgi:hypothetical protein
MLQLLYISYIDRLKYVKFYSMKIPYCLQDVYSEGKMEYVYM